jgi:hypothetical protein
MNTDTLFGGRKLEVFFEPLADGTVPPAQTLLVRQIPTRDYETGLQHYHDEPALVAFLVGQPREFAFTLSPQSYEAVLATGREVNEQSFFAACRRRMAAAQEKEFQAAILMARLPEADREVILRQGAKLLTGSPGSSSTVPRPRG